MEKSVALEAIGDILDNIYASVKTNEYESGYEDGFKDGAGEAEEDALKEVGQQLSDTQKQAYIDGYTACMQQVHDRAEFLCDVGMRDFVHVLEDHLLKLQMWKIGTTDYPPALVARASGS